MSNIGETVGGAINALPLDRMFTAPAMAVAESYQALSRQYLDFIKEVGMTAEGELVMVKATYEESQVDTEGAVVSTTKKIISVPLLAIVSHPNVAINESTVDFEMTIQASEETTKETSGKGGFEATVGWGIFKAKFHGSISHKSAQTRKTDTRARYAVTMKMGKDEMPEGMHRMLDAVLNASSTPKIEQTTVPQPQPQPQPPKPQPPKPNSNT